MNCGPDRHAGIATTTDAFHRGGFHLVQPERGYHRAGLDAMLLAACIEDGFDGDLADLGAGAGAAAFAVLNRCHKARAMLFEADHVMIDCARQALALPRNAHLAGRATVIEADVTRSGAARRNAGLDADRFEHVIANPPFNDARDRSSPVAEKAVAHAIEPQALSRWIRTAAAITRPGGRFTLVARPAMLGVIIGQMDGRFGALAIRPVHPRADDAAIRVLISGVKGSRARLSILPGIVLHEAESFTDHADALINGRGHLPMSV